MIFKIILQICISEKIRISSSKINEIINKSNNMIKRINSNKNNNMNNSYNNNINKMKENLKNQNNNIVVNL